MCFQIYYIIINSNSKMDFNDINSQLMSLEQDFISNPLSTDNVNSVNFQDPYGNMNNNNLQNNNVKRPTKTSGEHRNEINERLSQLNSNPILPAIPKGQLPPNMMPQFQSNTQYVNPQMQNQQQQMQNQQQRQQIQQQHSNTINNTNMNTGMDKRINSGNHFSSYYNQNFDTLNNKQQYPEFGMPQNETHLPQFDTHSSSGVGLLNVHNMYSLNQGQQTQPKPDMLINNGGYTKVEQKRTDYRQNMNTKLDNMIFDNVNNINANPMYSHIAPNNPSIANNNGFVKDTRMVIQDSNKDFNRQMSNDRMMQYSPLSRATHAPIGIASMSVNDFYSGDQSVYNTNPNHNTNSNYDNQGGTMSSRELLNSRMGNYAPLSRTIQPNEMPQVSGNNLKPIPTLNQNHGWIDKNINQNVGNNFYSDQIKPIITNHL